MKFFYSIGLALRGRILGRNWDKSFPPCYAQSTLLTGGAPPPPPIPPPPPSKTSLKLVCNVNIVYRNLKSENSQDYVHEIRLPEPISKPKCLLPVCILCEIADDLVQSLLEKGDSNPVESIRGRRDQVRTGIRLNRVVGVLLIVQ